MGFFAQQPNQMQGGLPFSSVLSGQMGGQMNPLLQSILSQQAPTNSAFGGFGGLFTPQFGQQPPTMATPVTPPQMQSAAPPQKMPSMPTSTMPRAPTMPNQPQQGAFGALRGKIMQTQPQMPIKQLGPPQQTIQPMPGFGGMGSGQMF